MNKALPIQQHSFHIPVMGLGFTIDTPIKVAPYGINSVVSIMDDELIEQMRAVHAATAGETYLPIHKNEEDFRAKRICAYLNLLHRIVEQRTAAIRESSFTPGSPLCRYFELLPGDAPLYQTYREMMALPDSALKEQLKKSLVKQLHTGSIDVNIMAKADKAAYDKDDNLLPEIYSNALSALRGYAQSELRSSLVISAGYNPRLFSYITQFSDFFPDSKGDIRKKITLKVSDYRSARVQGMILAKKGLWVSEFRIESGLNCGGHAFPTEGLLMGPILEEFKIQKEKLRLELIRECLSAWDRMGLTCASFEFPVIYSAQGGIGTHDEDRFLREFYGLTFTGWGSPFLLVPECTNVDEDTMDKMCKAAPGDFYLSHASPLGVPFNNFRPSSSNALRQQRIGNERPGSPCYKKFLASNTEYSEVPVCTASREYQKLKLDEIGYSPASRQAPSPEVEQLLEKECLCEGLAVSALLKNQVTPPHRLGAVSICPGPNMAYFKRVLSFEEMTGHIYGKCSVIASDRPHLFLNELKLYFDYYAEKRDRENKTQKELQYLGNFRNNLLQGIRYYGNILPFIRHQNAGELERLRAGLHYYETSILEEDAVLTV
ncbi:MAG: hypothetical protein JNL88_00620 [Bacteroidia bacterium]|nr:hypothetical protein [Bacteroidia bacterium]